MQEMDRISLLPDCLIHQVLSFLETKESVRTTVLSKRWIDIWKSVPYLELIESEFKQAETFINFTNSILLHKLQLETFILKWLDCDETSHEIINNWISKLVSLKPNYVEIELCLPNLENLDFLSTLFNCASIETLDLWPAIHEGWASLNPTVVNLPNLKYLQLYCLNLNDEFLQKILSGCPILEELTIENCFLNLTYQKIRSLSLKKLTMRYNEFSEGARLRIWIPGLVELEIEFHLGRVLFYNLESIERASVTLLDTENDYDGKNFKVLKGLLNAKTIELSSLLPLNTMFEKELLNLPVFEKLEILDFSGGYINKDLQPLISFLKLTPNVEKLFLRHVTIEKEYVFEGPRVDEIQCEKLKSVEIVCWKGYDGANKLIKYLLTYLQNIEDIKITHIDGDRIQEYVDASS
ncbi:hypothetical protein LUZ60_005521 [Juncus effusus]|nr:hypothetical protein LUZ60_005521 [Juncus effusus]